MKVNEYFVVKNTVIKCDYQNSGIQQARAFSGPTKL